MKQKPDNAKEVIFNARAICAIHHTYSPAKDRLRQVLARKDMWMQRMGDPALDELGRVCNPRSRSAVVGIRALLVALQLASLVASMPSNRALCRMTLTSLAVSANHARTVQIHSQLEKKAKAKVNI